MSESIETYPTQEQIERRAYELYLQRGGQDGGDVNDWLVAERELNDLVQRPIDSPAADAQDLAQAANGAADGQQVADADKMLEDMYARSRAIAAGAGSD
ncbi:MAG: DUF2934 domain-containing protein [Candidatus Acidiferrales bacterium]